MSSFVIENNQIVLINLRDSRTGEIPRIDLPIDPTERQEFLKSLQEMSDAIKEQVKRTREMLLKPCECGCGR